MNKYVRYYNKVQEEFISNGWDFSKAVGRSNPFTMVQNKQSFERFKKRVAKERRYNKERDKIKKESEQIWARIHAKGATRRANREKKLRDNLKDFGYRNRDINKIIDMGKEYGYGIHDYDKGNISSLISKKFIDSLVNEFEMVKNGEHIKVKGALSRFAEIPRIKERLQELERMVQNDKKALHHTEFVLQRFLSEVIPNRYNDFKEKHGRYITPPEQFYVNLMDDLLHMYNKYLK